MWTGKHVLGLSLSATDVSVSWRAAPNGSRRTSRRPALESAPAACPRAPCKSSPVFSRQRAPWCLAASIDHQTNKDAVRAVEPAALKDEMKLAAFSRRSRSPAPWSSTPASPTRSRRSTRACRSTSASRATGTILSHHRHRVRPERGDGHRGRHRRPDAALSKQSDAGVASFKTPYSAEPLVIAALARKTAAAADAGAP